MDTKITGIVVLGFLSIVSSVQGYNRGWIHAHATFYGGGDASGTMGMLHNLFVVHNFKFLQCTTFAS